MFTTKSSIKDVLGYDNTINILILKYSDEDILYIINCGKFRNETFGIKESIINSYIFVGSNLRDESSININILKMSSSNDVFQFKTDYTSIYETSILLIKNIVPCSCDKIWERNSFGIKCHTCNILTDKEIPLYTTILDRINLTDETYNAKIPTRFKKHIGSLLMILKNYATTCTKYIK